MLVLVIFILSATVSIDGARILAVFPLPSYSHQLVFRSLTQQLAKRGHEVVIITTDPAFPKGGAPPNITEIDVHDISYKIWRDDFSSKAIGKEGDLYEQIYSFMLQFSIIFEKQMKIPEVRDVVNNKKLKFDLLLLESYVRPALALPHVLKIPVILINTFGNEHGLYGTIGMGHPFLYPICSHQRIYNLTMWEKIIELYKRFWVERFYFTYKNNFDTGIVKRLFGSDTPAITELEKNVDMIFLSVYHFWDENRPVPPNVVYIGGILQKIEKELPKDLQNFMDSSKNGVIYMSLGTNAFTSLLPQEFLQVFINTFSRLPYDVIMKWDNETILGLPKNVKVGKWFPQYDILRHPKIKAFITQGGIQSTDEAITAGVPLIGIPMLADQWYNVEKYVHHGIGVKLTVETITEDLLINALQTVILNLSYRQNIAKLYSLIVDQPQTPLECAVWWTEHVLRHGGAKHLQAAGAHMSWTEYFELKLVSILLVSFVCIVSLFAVVLYYVTTYVRNFLKTKLKYE